MPRTDKQTTAAPVPVKPGRKRPAAAAAAPISTQAAKTKPKPAKTKSETKPKPETKPRGAGRPSQYDAKYVAIAEVLMREHGFTEAELAEALQVSVPTLTKWKTENSELLLAINAGRDNFDNAKVRQALRSRALGYTYDESEEGITAKTGAYHKVMHKSQAPDVTACIFWLVNRQPEEWKHVARTIIQGDPKNPVAHEYKLDLTKLPERDLEKLEDIITKARAEQQAGKANTGPSGHA